MEAVQHVIAVAGDSWFTIARKLAPTGMISKQLLDFAMAIAVANHGNFATSVMVGDVLHVITASIPVVTPPVVVPPVVVSPVPTRRMYVGASLTDQAQATQTKFETAVLGGKTSGVARRFDSSGVDAATLKSWLAIDTGKRHRNYSFKGTAIELTDAILDLIPSDGFETILTLQHESERPDKANDPVAMRSEFNMWITKIRAYVRRTGKKFIVPGVIYMSWLERDASATTTTADWFPTVPLDGDVPVYLGVDPYDNGGKFELKALYSPTLMLWKAHSGVRWGITEVGTHRTDDADRARWIIEGFKAAFADGAEDICWFNNDVGTNAGDGWQIEKIDNAHPTAPLSVAAFKSFVPYIEG